MPEVVEVETGAFAIMEDGLWLPGLYQTPHAAERAAGLREEVLSRLQARKNEDAGGRGIITAEDLDAVVA